MTNDWIPSQRVASRPGLAMRNVDKFADKWVTNSANPTYGTLQSLNIVNIVKFAMNFTNIKLCKKCDEF